MKINFSMFFFWFRDSRDEVLEHGECRVILGLRGLQARRIHPDILFFT